MQGQARSGGGDECHRRTLTYDMFPFSAESDCRQDMLVYYRAIHQCGMSACCLTELEASMKG